MRRYVWVLTALVIAVTVGTGWSYFKKQGTQLKNVQILKQFDSKGLIAYMSQQAKELGVKCAHCHNVKDYSSDENEHKVVARKMIQMVKVLNTQGFSWEGAPKVTCWECHMGNEKPPINEVTQNKEPIYLTGE